MNIVIRSTRRSQMVDNYGDSARQLELGFDRLAGRASYDAYLRDARWIATAKLTRRAFRYECYVCGLTSVQAGDLQEPLEVAHIDYPQVPHSEVIDGADLTRSDVVLLCHEHHRAFDALTDGEAYFDLEEMRRESVELLRNMRDQVREDARQERRRLRIISTETEDAGATRSA